ncbi:MAG TPA: hypothetical protein VMQ99_23015 [Acetobacteraceae bacterium]|jgi:hypothetical protein|nr:hypothetical protein [Acetobacteraceae bacterium]
MAVCQTVQQDREPDDEVPDDEAMQSRLEIGIHETEQQVTVAVIDVDLASRDNPAGDISVDQGICLEARRLRQTPQRSNARQDFTTSQSSVLRAPRTVDPDAHLRSRKSAHGGKHRAEDQRQERLHGASHSKPATSRPMSLFGSCIP